MHRLMPRRKPNGNTPSGDAEGSSEGAPSWVAILAVGVAVGIGVLLVALHLTGVLGPGAH
jgi:hypothetical protein